MKLVLNIGTAGIERLDKTLHNLNIDCKVLNFIPIILTSNAQQNEDCVDNDFSHLTEN